MAKILVIDDDQVILDLIKDILGGENHSVFIAQDGNEGIKIADEENLDLVILDLMMPQMSGFQVCHLIREKEEHEHVPIMILSVHDDTENRTLAFSIGADAYLVKPFKTEEFITRVNSLLRIKSWHDDLERKAQDFEKLNQTKSEFLSMVSHDLKSPLSAIIGYSMLLRDGGVGDLTDNQKEIIQTILQSSRNMFDLIRDLLDVAKIEEGKLDLKIAEIDISELIGMASDELGILCDIKNQELRSELDSNLPDAKGDFTRLKQVLNNLISNAIKFTPEGGTIIIRAHKESDYAVMIEVEDTGIGIPPKDLGVLFDRYQKSSEEGTEGEKGTGLGLAISKEIIEAHHGDIWVESNIGEGSHFYIFLPFDRRTEEAELYQKPQEKPRILVVDDQESVRLVIKKTLDKEFTIIMAEKGAEALDKIKEAPPQLIIADLMMPEMSGVEFIDHLKKDSRWNSIPIIVLTAKSSFRLKKEIIATGCNAYLIKPFETDALINKVKELLRIDRRAADRTIKANEANTK